VGFHSYLSHRYRPLQGRSERFDEGWLILVEVLLCGRHRHCLTHIEAIFQLLHHEGRQIGPPDLCAFSPPFVLSTLTTPVFSPSVNIGGRTSVRSKLLLLPRIWPPSKYAT
jgi:hypothetical protein